MKQQIIIFEINPLDGIMSRNRKFYPNNMTLEEINERFIETTTYIGNKYDFNSKNISSNT